MSGIAQIQHNNYGRNDDNTVTDLNQSVPASIDQSMVRFYDENTPHKDEDSHILSRGSTLNGRNFGKTIKENN